MSYNEMVVENVIRIKILIIFCKKALRKHWLSECFSVCFAIGLLLDFPLAAVGLQVNHVFIDAVLLVQFVGVALFCNNAVG